MRAGTRMWEIRGVEVLEECGVDEFTLRVRVHAVQLRFRIGAGIGIGAGGVWAELLWEFKL
jgi:hypothetical protein